MDNAKLKETQGFYCFGAFRLDAIERRLWCEDKPISIKPKQFDLLFYFVENAGRIIKKSELLDAVWADTYVEETTLARNVSWLRKLLENGAQGEKIIETVPKLGYRFTAEISRSENIENALIVEEQIIQYFSGEETIIIDDDAIKINEEVKTVTEERKNPNHFLQNVPTFRYSLSTSTFLLIGIVLIALTGSGYSIYRNYFKPEVRTNGSNVNAKVAVKNIAADGYYQRDTSEKVQIKMGSIVTLQNQGSNEAGYLDAWGAVKNKPEFSIVPTETMFVSTHPSPNRDNGSGSWEIVSATGKKDGEILVYGDKIHLRNRYPSVGYLDNCGFIVDMPVYKDFVKTAKFAVFTTHFKNRDNGTGIWIVSSNTEFDGNPVFEDDGIVLENGFSGGGFLDTVGRVNDIPAFNDYDGTFLVFIHESSTNRRPDSGVWIISNSKTDPE